MKHPPYRLDPSSYPMSKILATRIGDVNSAQHISNVAFAAIYEDARADVLRIIYGSALRTRDNRSVMAQANMAYLAEVKHPSALVLASGIGRVGRSSYDVLQGLFSDGRCVGLCDTTYVHCDADGPTPLSDAMRALLAPFLCQIPA
jgi:acyl-CoA thioester hydrolase